MGRTPKPKEETVAYQKRQAAIRKQKEKVAATRARRRLMQQAKDYAIQEVAEEAFGPGGLTPERKAALEAVVVGDLPVTGDITIRSPSHLRRFIYLARKKFAERAEKYVDVHFQSVRAAQESGDYETAAKHSEWALENLGSAEEGRVVDKPVKSGDGGPSAPGIVVGVNLGGVPQKG